MILAHEIGVQIPVGQPVRIGKSNKKVTNPKQAIGYLKLEKRAKEYDRMLSYL